MTRASAATGVGLAAGAALLAVLAHGLPPEAFFSGDSGAKLVAAREALAHPARPLDIRVPVIAGNPVPDLLGRFFLRHGDHAHANTAPLFPVLSAVPLAMLGERGLYILPALAWILTLWLAVRISRAAEARASAGWGVLVLVAGTPLLFYALEFWEHMPAVALTTGATLTALHASSRPHLWAAVGLLTGAAFLFRPEAAWYGLALVVLAGAPSPRLLRFLVGFGLTQVPSVAYNLLHFGTLVGPHLATNSAAALRGWVSMRWVVADRWFVNGAGCAVAGLISGAVFAGVGRRLKEKRALVLLTAGTLLVIAAVTVITVKGTQRTLPREGLWATFPLLGFAFLPVQGAAKGSNQSGLPFLRRTGLAFMVMAWLTTPHDGGAQWGPRFLLPAVVPLAVVSGVAIRGLLQDRRWRWASLPCVFLIVFGSVWIQRSAYRDLLITKRIYARIVSAVGEQAGRGQFVLSDLWWLDLVAAHHWPRLTFLYAESEPEAQAAMKRLDSAGVSMLLIVRSAEEETAGPTEGWLAGTRFRSELAISLPDRGLIFTHATRVIGGAPDAIPPVSNTP